MSENHELQLYEVSTKSLREQLVTMTDYIEMVRKVEAIPGNYHINLTPTIEKYKGVDHVTLDRLFVLPYPYKKPAWRLICETYIPQVPPEVAIRDYADNSHIERIVRLIHDRTSQHVGYAIQDELVSEIDNNYDYAAILHKLSGRIIFINYATLRGLMSTSIPLQLIRYILNRFPEKFPDSYEDRMRILDHTIRHNGKHNAWYCLVLNDANGKPFRTQYIGLTDRVPITIEEYKNTLDYFESTLQAHFKTLVVT